MQLGMRLVKIFSGAHHAASASGPQQVWVCRLLRPRCHGREVIACHARGPSRWRKRTMAVGSSVEPAHALSNALAQELGQPCSQ
eukprot:8157139-Alexandrium_andersonii.AAC.1